jgi:diacylglycerol kinase family enzyme
MNLAMGIWGRLPTRRVVVIHTRITPRSAVDQFCSRLDATHEVEVHTTATPEEGYAVAREAVADGTHVIVAAGGDGTVLSVLEPAIESSTFIVPIPLGTTNEFASYLGIFSSDDAAEAVLHGVPVTLDSAVCEYHDVEGRLSRKSFCSTAGVGILANVSKIEGSRVGTVLKRMLGSALWPLLLAVSAVCSRSRHCTLTLGGSSYERDLDLLEISKLPSTSNRELEPYSKGDSGILHFWLFGGLTLFQFAASLVRAMRGRTSLESSGIDCVSDDPLRNSMSAADVTRVRVEPDAPMALHLNGDYVGTTPATFELQPGSLKALSLDTGGRSLTPHPIRTKKRRVMPAATIGVAVA